MFSFFLFFPSLFLCVLIQSSTFTFSLLFNRFKEHSFLRGLHRLISRSLQALSLIELLLSIKNSEKNSEEKEGESIDVQKKEKKIRIKMPGSWVQLGKIPFSSLVVSEKIHDNMRKVLVGMLGDLCADGFVQEADRIVERLTEKCYLVS